MSALCIALPSKGRLLEQATSFLAEKGLSVRQIAGARDYRATLDGIDGVSVKLLSAADIAAALYEGEVHLGITGADLIGEYAADASVRVGLIQALGFGMADVVVAVPRAWIDVSTMADLDDVCTGFHVHHHRRLKVATKYPTLTRTFFAAHGIADYRIVESMGATEGAPAAGSAEAIVDITTTGATLKANDLKILDDGVILKSQAQLAAARNAAWSGAALAAAKRLATQIGAKRGTLDAALKR